MLDIFEADLGEPRNAQAAVELLDHYARDEMGGSEGLSSFAKEHLIGELRRRQQVHVVLAFEHEISVGLAILIEGFSTFACKPLLNVHDLVVRSGYRGRGIGRQLLAKAEEIALALGCCKLTLEVLEGNLPAQTSYKAFGFDGFQLDPKMGRALFWQKKIASG